MTQQQLSGTKITRNMLSAIESEKATPSLETLYFIAEGLDVPVGFLLSSEDDPFVFYKQKYIEKIRCHFSNREFGKCLNLISLLEGEDDETLYIGAYCCFEIGRSLVLCGSLFSGKAMLEKAKKMAEKTIYDTRMIMGVTDIYLAVAKNIQSPLLEFDDKLYKDSLSETTDSDFYRYLVNDLCHKYENELFLRHLKAKEMIKNRKYSEALCELEAIDSERSAEKYNAYFVFSLYGDMETCFRQQRDFENAYKFASKRMSLLEAFKS